MKTYDWLVVGSGLAGSALGYELARAGYRVLMLEQSATASSPTTHNATQCSYGGIAYWSGTTPLMRQLCQEGLELHRTLSAELDGDTEYREVDLLLTIDPDRDPQAVASAYSKMDVVPTLVDSVIACELEPLLNPDAIAAALVVKHGHVSPETIVRAYQQAFLRLGGEICYEQVTGFWQSEADLSRYQGVQTETSHYVGENVVVCAGGLSRSLFRKAGLAVRLYATIAELIELPPGEVRLQSLVMPAELKRFELEAAAGAVDSLWNEPDQEITPAILDAGIVQFRDGRIRFGQISRVLSNPLTPTEALGGEQAMRSAIGRLMPALKDQPGQWRSCPVAFSCDRLPLVGAVPDRAGIHVFSGFGNPFAILPPLARRFAYHAAGQPDPLLLQLSPARF
ncbi:FAD-binding oxidoreductase [Leptolyngbya sp. ST-U4]|uniref:NAD(P)/FAD-dependent oxidoreductase n=1 Tax=Leptolyngbya sp. ST-U4 TaxID=2933912 RepID=UPI001996DC68|nr:FAD-binding oxidoreductase [Cyanobacteria bacterium FACHB-502]